MFKSVAALFVLLVAFALVANRLLSAVKSERASAGSQVESSNSNLVTASAAARRSLCIASILARTNLESEARLESRDKSSENSDSFFQKKQREFLQENGLWDALSSRERTLLEKPYGSWSTQEIADGQWRAEALGIMLWALNQIHDIPPYDKESSAEGVMNALPSPGSSRQFVSSAALRNENEIREARNVAELWLWRARTTQLQLSGASPPDGWTFEKIISTAAEAAQHKKLFTPIEHDFPALNKAYSKLSDEEWHTLRSIAQERLYALNWLCKYADDWDAVPTGT